MVTLNQVYAALETLDSIAGDKHAIIERINTAMCELRCALNGMDSIEVKGRKNIDTLLGCMMAIDSIVGDDSNG